MALTARRLRPLFWALLALLAADLSRAAFVEPHWDEDACLAIGWLLSRGWRLYRDVFTHHLPLDYLPAWLAASVFGPSFTAARLLMIGLWAGCCALVYEWWGRRRGERLAPFLFALLTSQWLTYWYGEMMLVENLWAYAATLAVVVLGGPLGRDSSPPERRDALLLGALLSVIACASLVCAAPLACLAAWALLDRSWRPQRRWLLAGALAWLLPYGLWAALHCDLSLLYPQAVLFNTRVYARFFPYESASAVGGFWRAALASDARYFATALSWNSLERYFEGLLKLAVIVWVLRQGRSWRALWWACFIVALRSRPERVAQAVPFHAAPYFLCAALLVSAQLAALWPLLRSRSRAVVWGAALAAALVLSPTIVATSQATLSLREFAVSSAAEAAVRGAITRCAPAGQPILVMPVYPRLYLETRREPAAPAVFYFPWQAAWPPQHDAFLASLAARRPAVVVLQTEASVWGRPWAEYAADLQAELERGYLPVSRGAEPGEPPAFTVYARREEAKAFVKCALNFGVRPEN